MEKELEEKMKDYGILIEWNGKGPDDSNILSMTFNKDRIIEWGTLDPVSHLPVGFSIKVGP